MGRALTQSEIDHNTWLRDRIKEVKEEQGLALDEEDYQRATDLEDKMDNYNQQIIEI